MFIDREFWIIVMFLFNIEQNITNNYMKAQKGVQTWVYDFVCND